MESSNKKQIFENPIISPNSLYRIFTNYKTSPLCHYSLENQISYRNDLTEKLLENSYTQWKIPSTNPYPSTIFMMEADTSGRILAYSRESTDIEIFDIWARKPIKTISAHNDIVTALTFLNNDPTSFFTASLDKTICFWKDYKKAGELKEHQDWLRCLSICERNNLLVSGYFFV